MTLENVLIAPHYEPDADALDERYAPIVEWCRLRLTATDGNAEQIEAEFYRALDRVVRHPDFSGRDLGLVLQRYWDADPDDVDVWHHINSYACEASTVRSYLEGLGQVEKRSAALN